MKTLEKPKVILDTQIYDCIIDGRIGLDLIKNSLTKLDYCITHIQEDEINRCPDKARRARLLTAVNSLSPLHLSTDSFVEDVSRPGMAREVSGEKLEALRKGKAKHTEDALIGEVAINRKISLVTEDRLLRERVLDHGGQAISLKEFGEMIGKQE